MVQACAIVTFGFLVLSSTPVAAVMFMVTGQTEGLAGHEVDLFVYLIPEGATVATASHDLFIAPPLAIRAKVDGTPECGDGTHQYSGAFTFLPVGCVGTECTGVRASVDIDFAITGFGRSIYSCLIDVPADAPPGYYSVTFSDPRTEDGEGNPLPTTVRNGTISVPQLPKGAVLRVGSAEGLPGETVSFDVTVETTIAAQVIGALNFIDFDPATPVLDTLGEPTCSTNQTIGQPGSFSFSPPGCVGRGACTSIYADVGSTTDPTAFPSGAVMYSCTVAISDFAKPGSYPLLCSGVDVIDYESLIGSHCEDGEIRVLAPPTATYTPMSSPTFVATETAAPTAAPTAPPTPSVTVTSTTIPTSTWRPSDPGSCAITAPDTLHGAWLLLVPLVGISLARRRSGTSSP